MEHFCYLPEYRVLICRPCGRAIPAAHLQSHLQGHRKEWMGLNSTTAMSQLKQQLQEYELADPSQKQVPIPPPSASAFLDLPVEQGLRCRLCPFVTRSENWMQKHVRTHEPAMQRRGRPRKSVSSLVLTQQQPRPNLWDNIYCQRFFVSGPQSQYFQVTPSFRPTASSQTDLIRNQVYEQIRQLEQLCHGPVPAHVTVAC